MRFGSPTQQQQPAETHENKRNVPLLLLLLAAAVVSFTPAEDDQSSRASAQSNSRLGRTDRHRVPSNHCRWRAHTHGHLDLREGLVSVLSRRWARSVAI